MAETAVSGIFYTSDLHLGHEKVAGYRGFKCSADHDYELGERWRNQVTDRDHVWILGDLCLHDLDYALAFIRDLPGTKHLVWGNHDAGHPMHRNAHKQQRRYLDVFDSVQPFARRKIAGEDVLLSHFPYGKSPFISPITPGPEWRETQYPGYLAHVSGEIRGRFGRVLKPWIAGAGYEYVAISQGPDGVRNSTVHSLVCHAFHGPRPPGMQVAHNDGDPANNHASNLRWATPEENIADQRRHGTFNLMDRSRPGESNPRAKLTWADVEYIRSSDESAAILADRFGVGTTTIYSVRNGQTWRKPAEPINPDAGRDRGGRTRHSQYRLSNMGSWLLHGHTHGEERVTVLDGQPAPDDDGWIVPPVREIHVGVDAWDGRLVPEGTVAELIGGYK